MKFTYTKFGTLKEVQVAPPYWHIVNEEGKKASINFVQYARGQGFLDKLNELVGHPVVYRTTRRDESKGETGEWPSDHWFSDVFLDNGLSHNWPKEGDKETIQTIVELRLEIKRAAQRAERELKEAEQQRDFDQKQTEGMLRFEAEIEAMPYNEYVSKMNTDEVFRGIYEQFVKWKSARLRTDAERDQYEDQRAAWYKMIKPLGQMGFDWRYIGRIGNWEVSPDGNLKVWGEEYSEWYHFAFPQHVFFRTLQIAKLPTLQKHSVWALINDEDHTKDITYVDMTVRHFHDEEIDVPMDGYRSLHQTELLPHLIDKINDNAAHAEIQASGYGELAAELQMITPSDDELVAWYLQNIKMPFGDITEIMAKMPPEQRADYGDEYNRMFRFYMARRAEPDGEELFNRNDPIAGVESYNWYELSKDFEWRLDKENQTIWITYGDQSWDFDGGEFQQSRDGHYAATGRFSYRMDAMRKKLAVLQGYPIFIFANPIGTFVDVILAEGDRDALEPLQYHEDAQRLASLNENIRLFGKGKAAEAEEFQLYLADLESKFDQELPADEELIHFYNTQVRPLSTTGIAGLDQQAFQDALPKLMEYNPQFLKTFRQYTERKQKVESDTGQPYHLDNRVENPEEYEWVELPTGFMITGRAENPHAPNHFANSPVKPLGIYYTSEDRGVLTFDGGPPIQCPQTDRLVNMHDFVSEDMRRKVEALQHLPVCVLVHPTKQTFLDITIDDGRLESGELKPLEFYQDRETEQRLSVLTRAYAKTNLEAARTYESKYLEAQDRIDQLPPQEQFMIELDTEMVQEKWDWLSTGRRKIRILGMALFAENARNPNNVRHSHVDTGLAVRCGFDSRTKPKVSANIYERVTKNGEPYLNRVWAEVNGMDIECAIGIATVAGMRGDWCIKTVFAGGNGTDGRKHQKALKRLGYDEKSHREDQSKKIPWFLEMHRRAKAMAADPNHEWWTNPPPLPKN